MSHHHHLAAAASHRLVALAVDIERRNRLMMAFLVFTIEIMFIFNVEDMYMHLAMASTLFSKELGEIVFTAIEEAID